MAKKLCIKKLYGQRDTRFGRCVLQWIQESCDVSHVHIMFLTVTPALTHNKRIARAVTNWTRSPIELDSNIYVWIWLQRTPRWL